MAVDWDEYANEYDGVFLKDPVYTDTLDIMVDLASLAGGANVLDLGCGTGNITYQLSVRYPDCSYTGVDPSQNMREIFQDRFAGNSRCRVEEGDALAIPLPDGSADCVVSNLALHHITPPQREACAREIARVARDGCRLIYADRFVSFAGPPDTPDKCKEMIDRFCAWSKFCIDRGAFEKAVRILTQIPLDLTQDGEYPTSERVWMDMFSSCGFNDFKVVPVEPEEFGIKVLCAAFSPLRQRQL